MTATDRDSPEDPNAAARQPTPVLAEWVRGQLDEAGRKHVRRLAALAAQLQDCMFESDAAGIAQAVIALASSGRELHVDALRPGWIARLLGRDKAAPTRFLAAHERIVSCNATLQAEAARLAQHQERHSATVRGWLEDIEGECNVLQMSIDRGVTWLQELCTQLAQQRARGPGDTALAADIEAAQAFTQEFKRLQSAASMTRDLLVRANSLLERRAALVEQVRADGQAFEQAWMPRVGEVVEAVEQRRRPVAPIARANDVHAEHMRRTALTADACSALQQEEHLMAQHLEMLRAQLEPARPQG